MKRIIYRILIIVMGLGAFIMSSCTYALKYKSDIKMEIPITNKTEIRVNLPDRTPELIIRNSIIEAIVMDLTQSIFVNPVEVNPDIICVVDVNVLKYEEDVTWGALCFPAIFFGAPLDKLKAEVDITLRIADGDMNFIKSYRKVSHKEKWAGIYASQRSEKIVGDVFKESMDSIKHSLIRDRDEIIALIEGKTMPSEGSAKIVKPSLMTKSPNLIYEYALSDGNNDKILDGGERINLKVTVKNQGEGVALGVRVLLTGDSKAVSFLGKEKFIGDIPVGGEKEVIFGAILPYEVEADEGNIIIKVTEAQGFGALEEKVLRVAVQPAKIKREIEIVSVLIDVDQPLSPTSFKREDAYAVIIGITDYRSAKIPKVKYAKRDAETVKEYLISICGIPDENIILLTDDKATGTDLTAYIEEWLARNVTKKSFVFVYFAGHGTPNPEKGDAYLIPYDGEPGFVSKLYALSRFYGSLEQLPTDNIVVCLDACFSGAGGRSVIEDGKRPLVPVKIPETSKKVAIITASAADEISQDLDVKKHGLFTYYFLKGLRGEADVNGDSWITLGELYNYCQQKVTGESKKLGYKQTPKIFPELMADKALLRIGRVK